MEHVDATPDAKAERLVCGSHVVLILWRLAAWFAAIEQGLCICAWSRSTSVAGSWHKGGPAFASDSRACNSSHQWFIFSRNVGYVTPKNSYFRYLNKKILDQSIEKKIFI